MEKGQYELAVTAAFGAESETKKELIALGISEPKALFGSFSFVGDDKTVASLNLNLRTGERVLLKVGSFPAESFDALFEGVYRLPWENYLAKNGRLLLDGKCRKSKLAAVKAAGSVVKKAVLRRLSERYRTSVFPEDGAEYCIVFRIEEDVASCYLDTSGRGLHKRGYRDLVSEAPMKETLAATLLSLSDFSAERPFVDPFCGSGTLVIEAALSALNIAPGKNRDFPFLHWDFFSKDAYARAREEALDGERLQQKLRYSGFDIDKRAISLAMRHAERAGVKEYVHFQVQDVAKFSSQHKEGTVVTNPPYGERLLDMNAAGALYRTLGETMRSLANWSTFVITSAPQFEKYFGRTADRNRKFFNANMECHYFSYFRR